MEPIPVSVIGCGHLGTFHARLYAKSEKARLLGVYDPRKDRAEAVASELGTRAFASLDEAVQEAEAVSVASTTVTHREVAKACLEAGCHVLVEKPIADGQAAGRELVEQAASLERVLAVGHVERFSPAFQAARDEIVEPRYIEAHRLAPFVARSLDVDVVLDLMIHDIDLTLATVGDEVVSIDASGVPVLTGGADIASARIHFRNGAVANLTASRVSQDKVRKIRFFGKGRYHSLDLFSAEGKKVILTQGDGASYPLPEILTDPVVSSETDAAGNTQSSGGGRRGPGAEPEMDAAAAVPESMTDADRSALRAYLTHAGLTLQYGAMEVASRNALFDEIEDFLGAVRGAELRGASGADGLAALAVAEEIRTKVRESLSRVLADAQ